MGTCSYYRRFVKDFAKVAQPLHHLMDNHSPFLWSKQCENSFEQLKKAMITSPVLAFPDLTKPYCLDCDASAHSIGAVLSQNIDGEERVVAYFSKTLSTQQKNYCATRRELLAAVLSIEHFHEYLYGTPFTLRTDHASLTWLMSFKRPEGQLARWLETLQSYTFDIVHRPGKSHGNADGLSRRPCGNQCSFCERKEKQLTPKEVNFIRKAAVQPEEWQDDAIRTVLARLQMRSKPSLEELTPMDPKVKQLVARWDSLQANKGILYHKWEKPQGRSYWQVVVPESRIPQVLQQCHNSPSGGHFGFFKTLGKVRQQYFWPGMASDIKAWCRTCVDCQKIKGPHQTKPAPLKQFSVGGPFERVGMDILGPFPSTRRGNRFVLVVSDYFTKWPEAIAVPNQEAETVASALVEHVFSRHGVPAEIHTDQGRNFESRLVNEMSRLLGTRHTRSTPLHPQSGGLVERLNRTIAKYLTAFIGEKQDDWDKLLPLFLLAYRSSPHVTTGFSPALMVYGREFQLPEELVRPALIEPQFSTTYAFQLRKALLEIREFARQNMGHQMKLQKDRFDRHAKPVSFQEGDWVWVHEPRRTVGRCPKLQPQWTGPWTVLQKRNDVLYRVQLGRAKKLIHVNRIARADVKKTGVM